MKEKIKILFEKLNSVHAELTIMAQELDTQEAWQAEGAMQDVKAAVRNVYEKL